MVSLNYEHNDLTRFIGNHDLYATIKFIYYFWSFKIGFRLNVCLTNRKWKNIKTLIRNLQQKVIKFGQQTMTTQTNNTKLGHKS